MSDHMTGMTATKHMIDIFGPKDHVEIALRDGKLWVNVDGVCRLRIQGIPIGAVVMELDGLRAPITVEEAEGVSLGSTTG